MSFKPEGFDAIRPRAIPVLSDSRGELWKALASSSLQEGASFGEIYVLITRRGAVRGNHYHGFTTEWFLPLRGKTRCRLALPGTDCRSEFVLDAENPAILRVPPGIAHSLSNDEEEPTTLLAYADQEYNRKSPDVIPYDFSERGP